MENDWLSVVRNIWNYEAELGMSIADIREGGGRKMDLGEVLLVSTSGNTTFWVGEVGGEPILIRTWGGYTSGAADQGVTTQAMI